MNKQLKGLFLVFFQETETAKRKLQMMKQKKMTLIAEVRYNLYIITLYLCGSSSVVSKTNYESTFLLKVLEEEIRVLNEEPVAKRPFKWKSSTAEAT